MARDEGAWIGKRVAHLRDLAGYTQERFAAEVGKSQQYISAIERGTKPVTKFSMIVEMAGVLGVPVSELIGLPQPVRTPRDLLTLTAVAGIRAALFYPPDSPVIPRPVEELALLARQAMAARMACDYAVLGAGLPALLAETRTLFEESGSARAGELLAQTAVTASLTLKPIGWSDLALQLADLARQVARRVGEATALAAAEFAYAQCVHAAGAARQSLTIAERAADATPQTSEAGQAWKGLLHLHSAYSAAAAGDGDLADQHFGEADALAQRVLGDPWLMEFTPANVALWRVGAALENGGPDRAAVLADRVPRGQLRTRQRISRLHMDAGRGLYLAGQPDRAVREFLRADDVAPDELRTRPSVLEIVGQMARDARGAGSGELRRLVEVTGVAA